MSSSKDKKCESHFWPKVVTKNGVYHFYPSAKSRRELKIKTLGVIFRGASAYHLQNTRAPPKQAVCQISDERFCRNFCPNFFQRRKMICLDHLKCVFQKFEAERSYPRGVNSRSKFCKKKMFLASKNEMSGIV